MSKNNHVSTFPYPGGKGRKSDWIISKMPDHDTYVSVFGGSGAVIYNKQRSKNEVYNDYNEDLVQFFKVLRDRTNDLAEWVRRVPYSRAVYEEWVQEFHEGYRPSDPVERAGRFWVLRYMQFAGAIASPNGFKTRAKRSPARTFDNARKRLHGIADRFSDVIIECKTYDDVLGGYDDDSVDVLMYCDPPYPGGGEAYYGESFNHAKFVAELRDVESDWMVSYGESLPDGLADLGTVFLRERRHRMCRTASDATEYLVCSFDPGERRPFVLDSDQATLGGRDFQEAE